MFKAKKHKNELEMLKIECKFFCLCEINFDKTKTVHYFSIPF